ncbi:YceD family protein [Halanaerobium salsuginis]|uniref:DUF177 domain-containing protein n=1 Tax=Halanaerobium salsuginis TaxID=29563 RepID=A0A1I4EK47_9FIRM|nr:DUF177 domain-containing protein [Halanaerobium salsuginis]SFL06128.1 uncharacterized protein SAMN02983006_00022 [Halanaerobium salsuginis]
MYINLSDLKEIGGKKEFNQELELNSLKFAEREIEVADLIEINLEVFNTTDSFLVKGTITSKLKLNCSRCLKEFIEPIELAISEEVLKEEMEDQSELFIDEIIIDNIILSLPMKVLCSDDCKGLCPQCGQNLNEGECDCEIDTIDPRLAKLKEFYDKKDS